MRNYGKSDDLRKRYIYKNCHDQENARRREQVKSGKLKIDNGLESADKGE